MIYKKASFTVQLMTFLVITVPLASVIAAPFFVWGWGFGWTDLFLLLLMYFLTAIGITVGFHRLFVHRSFETYTWVKFILAVLGEMAVQAPLFKWAAVHRYHHKHSDMPEDPHTPHHQGLLKGIWRAHIGWLFEEDMPNIEKYTKDLQANKTLRFVNYSFPIWVILGLVIPATLGGIITQTWQGAITGFIWGGLIRLFLVHHVTWSINSACHMWGTQPYKSNDESRDNVIFGVLAMGEGWHASHHAFPTSAKHGLKWFQIDISYYFIRLLSVLNLAWDIKVPTKEAQEKERKK